jgi:hypothetical protein
MYWTYLGICQPEGLHHNDAKWFKWCFVYSELEVSGKSEVLCKLVSVGIFSKSCLISSGAAYLYKNKFLMWMYN